MPDEAKGLAPMPGKHSLSRMRTLARRALEETERALVARKGLTDRFLREIETEIEWKAEKLRLLGDPWQHGDRTEWEFMRISLDKALTATRKERRERLLQSWRDLRELEEQRLQQIRELGAFGRE